MIDWFTTTIASSTEGLPHEHAIAPHTRPQRRRRLLRPLWRRHSPGRAGRLQPTDRLWPRPTGRAAVANPGPRDPSGRDPEPGPGGAEEAPDHSTIGRWVADEARKARPVLEALDAACIPEVRTLAVDEIFFGGDRPWSASSL
jgi:hypothetical protein